MAFNFNWSPLIADTSRARDMLTTALNKSPKPPIIVDDIIVNELNLGSKPPELEILEIGDLAEDKFRGIFKMRYDGDAYLTLKTKVQANPLNTYLSTKPGFASPETVAASSSLTIPLQITLSEIRLSGFVILVFSKQKGITTVFRNDPLESLKVSSTFDSIPFVRDYLQRTIEQQLRVLFMEDLPAIIHRLSLKVFNPESQAAEDRELGHNISTGQAPVDPFASPPQQAFDSDAWPLDNSARFSLGAQGETYATFSQKNLLRLAALTESQRTLSLFTPSIRDTVYRAWASAAERTDTMSGSSTPSYRPTSLSRIQSSLGIHTQTGCSSASSQTSETPSLASRPTLSSFGSAPTVYTLGGGRSRPHGQRKRKNRIVNLRKNRNEGLEGESASPLHDAASVSSGYTESAGQTGSRSGPSLTEPTSASTGQEREGEVNTPERSPQKKVGFQTGPWKQDAGGSVRRRPSTPSRPALPPHLSDDPDATPRASTILPPREKEAEKRPQMRPQQRPRMPSLSDRAASQPDIRRSVSDLKLQGLASPLLAGEGSSGGILENAWMMKMANEIARKVAEEKSKGRTDLGDFPNTRFWRSMSSDSMAGTGQGQDEYPPPAYVS